MSRPAVQPFRRDRRFRPRTHLLPTTSLVLCVAISVCYLGQFDGCALITVFPFWAWILAGLIPLTPHLLRQDWRPCVTVTSIWFLGLLYFSDSPTSLFRAATTPTTHTHANPSATTVQLRVITLNCDSSVAAIEELAVWQPDIILIQESPGRDNLATLARRLFGDEAAVLWGVDGSIMARGQLTSLPVSHANRGNFVHARLRLSSGAELHLASLRLLPSPVRIDLWNPDAWTTYADNRRARRDQLRNIVKNFEAGAPGLPAIIGGDFNAPAGDVIYDQLRPELRDAFAEAGVGWGNTILNDYPLLRIDQIWISRHWQATAVFARRTRLSDHRMVVCDLRLLRE